MLLLRRITLTALDKEQIAYSLCLSACPGFRNLDGRTIVITGIKRVGGAICMKLSFSSTLAARGVYTRASRVQEKDINSHELGMRYYGELPSLRFGASWEGWNLALWR